MTEGTKKWAGYSALYAVEQEKEKKSQSTPPTGTSTSTTSSGTSTSTTSSTTNTTPKPSLPPPAAPTRDFMKVANSIGREAVAGGLFSGKSKQLYDYLYSRTRGAIMPCRTVRLSNKELMLGADISAEMTLRANVSRLGNAGLIRMVRIVGSHEGNEYTVFLPEEIETGASGTSTTRGTNTSKNLPPLVPLESSTTITSLSSNESTTSSESKTSFKTNTERSDDDEAFAEFAAAMSEAARDITGRELTVAEARKWRDLADVLITELKIAAARTTTNSTVNNVPAFLAEHLRRRLFKKDRKMMSDESKAEAGSAQSVIKVDVKKCPDCGGSNWWYPQGPDKGVVRCGHEKLKGTHLGGG
jgi:hypothetical protein